MSPKRSSGQTSITSPATTSSRLRHKANGWTSKINREDSKAAGHGVELRLQGQRADRPRAPHLVRRDGHPDERDRRVRTKGRYGDAGGAVPHCGHGNQQEALRLATNRADHLPRAAGVRAPAAGGITRYCAGTKTTHIGIEIFSSTPVGDSAPVDWSTRNCTMFSEF